MFVQRVARLPPCARSLAGPGRCQPAPLAGMTPLSYMLLEMGLAAGNGNSGTGRRKPGPEEMVLGASTPVDTFPLSLVCHDPLVGSIK